MLLYYGKNVYNPASMIKVNILSERMMEINLSTDLGTVSFINVYLPTDYKDPVSHDQFCMCLGQIGSALDVTATKTSYYGLIGDCNANSKGSSFFTELSQFSSENGLIISDVQIMGALTLAGTGGGGVDATPPAVFLEYLFCLPFDCHHFFYSFPPIFFTSPLKISRP